MNRTPARVFFGIVGALLLFPRAEAYISGSVSAGPGKSDVELTASFERGRLGAQNIPESQITQNSSITTYDLKVGHNFGAWGGLEDVTLRLSGRYFGSAPEAMGATPTYGEDSGGVFGLETSANFLHEPERVVGAFARFSLPSGMNRAKFANPKVDTFALGLQGGFEISSTFGFETLWYYGTGLLDSGIRMQNASLVGSSLLSARWPSAWPQGLTLKFGPFFESELTERNDTVYGTTGIRGFRVGLTAIGSVAFTSALGMDLGYVQKLSGAYFRATKDVFVSLKATW
ncbi:MAG: hypothetical protein AB7P04_05910 [Bacteriovoracia bacterium]